MNLNFDYMHVSFGNEALNTVGILNNEHLINEEDKAKIKPIENETIKINLGTLENPKEVRIYFKTVCGPRPVTTTTVQTMPKLGYRLPTPNENTHSPKATKQ